MKQEWKDNSVRGARMLGVHLGRFLKWGVVSGLVGVVVGLVGTAFFHGMVYVTALRQEHSFLLLGLPFAGLAIVWLYSLAGRSDDRGTNTVLTAVRTEDKIPVTVAPLIFISTILTHLCGGSAGREGAALQIGGSIGSWIGRKLHMNNWDVRIVIMSGMSAAFSAVFGTPIAATFFAMEVTSVGIMHYSALVPCAFASLVASGLSKALGAHGEGMTILEIPDLALIPSLKVVLLGVGCAAVSVLFCIALHKAQHFGKKWIPNPYLRIAAAGVLIILLTIVLRTTDYLGAGMNIIEQCIAGETRPEAFLLKILFTAITLGAGFKGGEIVPSFFVGASFGCLVGQLLGISPSMCAAVGMIAVFCGVTNSPVTSLLIALELFGMDAVPFFLLGIAVSYRMSGYYSLYASQKIVYSKYKTEYLNRECS